MKFLFLFFTKKFEFGDFVLKQFHLINIFIIVKNYRMKSTCFVVAIFLFLFVQYTQQTTEDLPITTPSAWTQGWYPAACNPIGTSKVIQDPASVVPLTTTLTYLKTSYVFYQYSDFYGNPTYSQNIFKSYISVKNSDGVQTILSMSSILGFNGTNVTQTYTIQNTYEFIDANGPYIMLKQTDGSGAISLSLYIFDSAQGATRLRIQNFVPISTFPNEIFQALKVNTVSLSNNNFQTDPNFKDIIGTVLSRNTATKTAVVRQLTVNGLGNIVYSFALSDITSEVYTNLLLGLQINGNTFHTYVSPAYGSGNAPYDYLENTDQISTATDLWNNNIVITFLSSMMVATFDDDRKNGNIFFLLSDTNTYALSLVNMKTTRTAPQASPAASLQYLTDYQSYIIELDLNPNTNTFFMVWTYGQSMDNFTFLNTPQDPKNSQILADFTNPSKISSFINCQITFPSSTYASTFYIWIYKTTGIIKYVFTSTKDGSGNINSITINKEFVIELDENLLINSVGPNFQVTTHLQCVCQNAQVTEMICFYGNNACTFTVQTLQVYCNPFS